MMVEPCRRLYSIRIRIKTGQVFLFPSLLLKVADYIPLE
uniref:Putative 2OG-Fe(II) oxygenase n=2 Tax=unclassified Caudoviricetes TaxID=2788787 RepID=A0A8S5NPN1_9CAUD|nr:MAG TPA: putative 2OG-Fe(II) oxygenase [Myoviridae sp. ctzRR1]DAD96234.1 MAG TPA: putative 2OG-Fe(II) oxygenase [Myoviridae sp. ct0mM28]